MTCDIVLAGVGGQGVLSIAAIIASAAMAEGLEARQSEVHGMAQRGGAVSAHLRLSDARVRCDLVPLGGADLVLSMEPLESLRYASYLKPSGRIVTAAERLVNIPDYPELVSILEAVRKVPGSLVVEAEGLARQAGSARAVNMVMVGAASPFIPVSRSGIEASISRLFSSKDASMVEANLAAFAAGAAAASSSAAAREGL
jgi:indolepyruvate ferredoxin oxidoreductase beta subunit